MAKKIKKGQINLIPQNEFESSVLGRILTWLLSTFRYIVIATEMVVMLAFFSRIWLDARNADLSDEIKQKEAVLSASRDFEEEYVQNQTKLAVLKNVFAKEGQTSKTLEEITALTPTDVVMLSYSQTVDGITVRATSPSEQSISQYIVNLEGSETFDSINLEQIKTDQDSSFLEFSLKIMPKTG